MGDLPQFEPGAGPASTWPACATSLLRYAVAVNHQHEGSRCRRLGTMAFPYMRLLLCMRQAEGVKPMRLFTSLRRENGETLAYEVVTLALIIFAIFGVLSLLHRV